VRPGVRRLKPILSWWLIDVPRQIFWCCARVFKADDEKVAGCDGAVQRGGHGGGEEPMPARKEEHITLVDQVRLCGLVELNLDQRIGTEAGVIAKVFDLDDRDITMGMRFHPAAELVAGSNVGEVIELGLQKGASFLCWAAESRIIKRAMFGDANRQFPTTLTAKYSHYTNANTAMEIYVRIGRFQVELNNIPYCRISFYGS
jgi:hypothetical protein